MAERSLLLIFPHQLFEVDFYTKKISKEAMTVVLIEEELFFAQYKFHKKKLMLHRASMKWYAGVLEKEGFKVEYRDFNETLPEGKEVTVVDVSDDWLKQKIEKAYDSVNWIESPNFFGTTKLKKKQKYLMANFYRTQRKALRLLVDDELKPLGGAWSFDRENRKKVPKGTVVPVISKITRGKKVKAVISEAREYVETHFADHYGEVEGFEYPVTHNEADEWYEDFLKHRFKDFGVYEDAMVEGEHHLFHAVLTPMLNCGLLSPRYVVRRAVEYYEEQKGTLNEVPFNSLEGFVRQIIGWREFVREVYLLEGRTQRTSNFFRQKRKMPRAFWEGATGLRPVDDVIKKALKTGYSHHIERLMVISNIMVLCEISPDEIYEWFMVMYVDAYDWVMVPNVYGMSVYADGGLMTTKPYISSSNYIRKMSDYPKGEWCEIWDGLYWRFISKHYDFFASNPRLKVMVMAWERMNEEKKKAHLEKAEQYLKALEG